jgi:CubicO group peptidase (beta-lactamase class C family)
MLNNRKSRPTHPGEVALLAICSRKLRITNLIISFLLLLVLGNFSFSQTKNTGQTVKRIAVYLDEIERVGFTGTLLVEINGRTVISKGYGFRNLDQRLTNTPDTIFDIGSITKQFTAAAILKLEMQGKLSTDDKISKYFGNVAADKSEITIHHLLRHSSGLPSVVGGDYDRIGESDFVDKVMQAPLKFENGTRFSYSNVGYSLLAIIIEKISGLTYEQFLYENLWRPSQMESTGYKRPTFDNSLIAIGYKDDKAWGRPSEKEWDKDGPYWHLKGNGGILSTTEDLYKWNLALLTDRILSKEAKQKYYFPQLRPGENSNPYYAYGWDVLKTKRNTTLVTHNGANGVFYADFYRYLDEGITIIMLSNRAHPNFLETNAAISKIIFDPAYKPVIPIPENEANRSFTGEVARITLEKGLAAGIEEYKKGKNKAALIERIINNRGYDLLSKNKLKEAIDIFKLNVFAFPRSANAFDSLGEAYMEAGNKNLAIENYKKSLLLNPDNANAQDMLKKLTNK